MGAFGGHALKKKLEAGGKMENWKTAVMYQLFHAVAVLSVSVLCDQNERIRKQASNGGRLYQRGGQCMALGSLLFSGSIYLLCLDVGPKRLLGPTTPVGGLLLIAGWSMLGMK